MDESTIKKNTDNQKLKKKIGTGLMGANTRLLLMWANSFKDGKNTSNTQDSSQTKKK